MEGGAAGENWAAPAAGSAGDEAGKAEGLTCKRFVAGVWVGAAPVMHLGGDGRRQPLTSCSGELLPGARKWAVLSALVAQRERARNATWLRN
jgi:hypothetical protein